MRERTPLEVLRLEGSPNIGRSVKREQVEREAPPLDAETKSEIQKLDELISLAMRAAKRGSTFRGRPNPAHDHILKLCKARDLLLRGKARPQKTADAITGVEEFFKKAGLN